MASWPGTQAQVRLSRRSLHVDTVCGLLITLHCLRSGTQHAAVALLQSHAELPSSLRAQMMLCYSGCLRCLRSAHLSTDVCIRPGLWGCRTAEAVPSRPRRLHR